METRGPNTTAAARARRLIDDAADLRTAREAHARAVARATKLEQLDDDAAAMEQLTRMLSGTFCGPGDTDLPRLAQACARARVLLEMRAQEMRGE